MFYRNIFSGDNSYAGGDGSDIKNEFIVEGPSAIGDIFVCEDFEGTNLPNSEYELEDDTPLAKLSASQSFPPSSAPDSQSGSSTARIYRFQNRKIILNFIS